MRISRIHTDQRLAPGLDVALDAAASNYVSRVLKLRRGYDVILFNGDGQDYTGEIRSLQRERVVVRVGEGAPGLPESSLRVELAQAISRGERMDQTLQKSVELGVSAIQPLFTRRVGVRLEGSRLERRLVHWQGVVRSACEQSGRSRVPAVGRPLTLSEWTQQAPGEGTVLTLDPGAELRLSEWEHGGGPVYLLVGPEGGFEDDELALLGRHGAVSVALGPRVLRTETAAPAALAILQSRFGDL